LGDETMKTLKDIAEQQQLASPTYFDDAEKDRMMATILSLAEEVCVLRDRLDTCRRLADEDRPATAGNVDAFVVSDSLRQERLQNHTSFFETTLGRIQSA